jgi:4-hydroxy-tetrahydrodipicolinate reductase
MKIALLGQGKTGSYVLEVARDKAYEIQGFSRENPPKLEDLQNSDVVISFLPAAGFESYMPLLLEAKTPVVTGTTGIELSAEFSQKLSSNKLHWLHAHNFALGMNLIHQMINQLKSGKNLFSDVNVHIHEVHHTKKIDAPSGTALSWKEWIGGEPEVTSKRTGDVVGDHQLVFETSSERITIRHEALNRRIFAEGAVWAAETLLKNKEKLQPKLYTLNQLTEWATKG